MRKPVGLDLNGWHDFGCRDWSAEDPDEALTTPVTIDGGFGSVIVEHGDVRVGGPQAILSPIGRGNGWGAIGALEKRRWLTEHWSTFLAGMPFDSFVGDIRAAVDAVSVQADQLVVCMPDRIEMSEARQQALLAAFSGPRRPRVTLLWRPVALLLDLLDGGQLSDLHEGQQVVCLIHSYDGFEVQRLVLRRLREKPDSLAPERAGPGGLCCPDLGLARLLEHASDAVAAVNPELADRPTEISRLPWYLLYQDGKLSTEQVVRRDNGNWLMVHPPQEYHLPGLPLDLGHSAPDADLVVLLSPLATEHRARLANRLADKLDGVKLLVADPAAAARGALFASRRIERNIPHYLDRLDQISLVVSRKDGPTFEDLIPKNATVPGNREYISEPITSMVWPAGMAKANFYIRKGSREIRHWVTPSVEVSNKPERLEIRLRQMPAQGWAKLSITSPDWDVLHRAPIHLDWEALPIDPRTDADILASLERPRPVVPQRVRYAAHIGLWDGSLRHPGVLAILKSFNVKSPSSLKALADSIRTSFRVEIAGSGERLFKTVYPVGTDGELPDKLDEVVQRQFDDAINHVTQNLLQAIRRRRPPLDDNTAILCLSWIFARCPMVVQHEMAAALNAIRSGGPHPLLAPRQSARVLVHGLGRVVTSRDLIRTIIPKFYADIGRANFLAALSSLLSRPEATPFVLSDADVETIAERTIQVFREMRIAYNFGTNFKYALMVVAGLLRVRERDPWALLAERSELAHSLVEELSTVLTLIRSLPQPIKNEAQKLQILNELIQLLLGEGGSPDILMVVDAMSDE
jgi:hypothetical protein